MRKYIVTLSTVISVREKADSTVAPKTMILKERTRFCLRIQTRASVVAKTTRTRRRVFPAEPAGEVPRGA